MIKYKIKIFSKVSVVFVLAFSFILTDSNVALAASAPTLGAASSFAVLAGSGITFAGAVNSSTINGDIGTYSTATITGLGNVVVNGTNHAGDGVTQTAKTDLTTAYLSAESQAPATTTYPAIHDLGGETLSPGIYNDPSSFGITGTLTLDGGGNSDAVFIFQAGSTLITAGSSIVSLTNGAQARNVFWQVGSSATLGTSSTFRGNILALTSITLTTGANVEGRMLAQNGTVTLDTNTITVPTTLTLNKTVTNDNGGTALNTAWTLSTTAPSPTIISGATGNVNVTNAAVAPGAYTLSESGGPAGYNASTYSCVKNGGGAVVSNSITLAAGDNAVCTITNNDIAPQLHLRKLITNDNGGTATAANFTLTANGTGANDISGTSPVDSGAGLLADTFALSETNPSGYTASAWVCVGGTQVGSNITVGINQSATCTITNNDIAPQLHLRKLITNDNGGTATAANFTLTANGTGANDISGTSPVDSGAGLLADTFVLSETNPGGYTASAWVCVGGTQVGNNITVGIDQSATCTITNDDNAPSLTLNKIVVNDDSGTASESDWTITATGPTTISGSGAAGSTDVVSGSSFDQGTYTLSESAGPAGYAASSWSCTNGITVNGSSQITLSLGQSTVCTVTNNDIPPSAAILQIIKHVVTDNGGTADASDFTINVTGTNVSDPSFFGAESPGTTVTLDAGAYSVDENAFSGYTKSLGANCSGTIGAGETITCTITNDDIAPSLTLNKIVVNDDSGVSSESAWTITATGPTTISGSGAAGSTDVVSGSSFDQGTYTLSESAGPAGYAASSWSCTNGITVNGSSQITLSLGQSTVCTVTNDDNDPTTATLNIIKTVTNDNDGTSIATDFNLYVKLSGSNVTGSPAIGIVSPGRSYTLAPGTYAVSEDADSAYTSSFSGDCDSSGNVTLLAGDDRTCTITNDDASDDEEDNSDVDIKVKKTASDYKLSLGPKKVTFTYKVTNEGDAALTDISVKDDECDDVNYKSGDDDDDDKLDTDEEWKYTCRKTLKKTETNTVAAKGTANGERVKDTDTAKVVVSVPGLPSAGFAPAENSLWNIGVTENFGNQCQ